MQRSLLGRVAGLVAEDSQNVAVRIAALDTLCTLLGLLGEVLPEALPSLQQPIQHQLISSHSCLRHQVLAGLMVQLAACEVAMQHAAAGPLNTAYRYL